MDYGKSKYAEVVWVKLPNTTRHEKFLSSSMPGTGICKNHKIRGISTKTKKIKLIEGGKV